MLLPCNTYQKKGKKKKKEAKKTEPSSEKAHTQTHRYTQSHYDSTFDFTPLTGSRGFVMVAHDSRGFCGRVESSSR